MARQEALFEDAGGLPVWKPGRDDDPTRHATFVLNAEDLKVGDTFAVMGRLERIVSIAMDTDGNYRVATSRTGKRSGYFKFPTDKVRIVPRKPARQWRG